MGLLGFKGKWLVKSADEFLKNGALVIEGDEIRFAGTYDEAANKYPELDFEDLGEVIVFPGLVNAHTHISMSIFRGIAEDLPLMTWLQQYIFPVESKLKPYWVYWGAKLSILEMMRSGITLFCDMYIFEPEVIKAVKETGLRALLGEGLFDFPSPGYGPLEKGLALTEKLLKTYQGDEFIHIAVSPHTLYTCSPDTVKKCVALAKEYGAKLHIHLSENTEEVKTVKEKWGGTPVEVMQKIGGLWEDLVAAHCVKVSKEEIKRFADAGASVVHCPESNLKLGSGIAPVPEMLKTGVRVAIGTDGPASNNDLDMFSEMRSASLIQKGLKEDPTVLSAKEVFKMATEYGASALGFKNTGKLLPGFKADFGVIDLGDLVLQPDYNPLTLLVYSVKAGQVRDLMIGGKWVMKNKEPLTINENEVRENIKNIQREVEEILREVHGERD